MISIIAISVLAMATVYIIDYYDRQDDSSGGHSEVSDETKIKDIEIIDEKEEKQEGEIDDHKISSLVPSRTTVRSIQTTPISSTTTNPRFTTTISSNDLFVIGITSELLINGLCLQTTV